LHYINNTINLEEYIVEQGLIAVGFGLVFCALGYYKGKHDGSSGAIDALINMRILKLTSEGNIVRGDKLDLE
jgi:hypothetical protein